VGGSHSSPFRANSRQAGRDLSLTCLVSGLDLTCGDSVWLGFARRALVSARNVEDGFRSVSSLFSRVIPSGVPGGSLPTLKTGNGESRSWVQIPPHPLGCSRRVVVFPGTISRVPRSGRGDTRGSVRQA